MRIDGHAVPAEEFGRWLIDIEGGRQVKSFAEQWLVRRAAEKEGVDVSPEQVEKELDAEIAERIRGAFLGKKEDWLDELRRLERTEGGHRAQRTVELEPLMLAIEICRKHRVVPEEKIERDWVLFYGPGGREYTLRGIKCLVEVVTPEAGTPREIYDEGRRRAFAAQLSRALELRERALDGEDFEELARVNSDDKETRERGGLMTKKFRRWGWTDEVVDTLAKMKSGEISQPMYAQGGYWILQVVDVVETPYAKVRDELERRLVELGPEQDESGNTWNQISAGMQVKVLPGMFQAANLDMETREPVMGLTINGTPVPRAEFALWLLHSRGESYVRTFAEHWLVERKAASLGLSATPAEIEARTQWFLDRMVDMKHDGSRETWKTYLLKTGRDEDAMLRQFRQRMKIDLLAERILMAERKITNEQVHARYAQLYGENGRWIEARVIQLDFVPPPLEPGLSRDELEQRLAAERAKLRTAAEGVRRRLDDGEDFATLARAINTDAGLKSRGGKLDGRFRPDTWPEDVGRAVSELSPGQLAGPLEVERGYAIFEVLTSKPVPFDEVAAQLRHELETEPIPESDLAAYRNVLVKQARVEELAPMYE
jgi:parvulin-like peptidyl-prolyl isomerase